MSSWSIEKVSLREWEREEVSVYPKHVYSPYHDISIPLPIEDKIANFINQNLPSVRRNRDAKVDSTYKYLQQLSPSLFPTPTDVFDNTIGNSPGGLKNFHQPDISLFKRKCNKVVN